MAYERSSSLYRSKSGEDGYGFAFPGVAANSTNGNYPKFDSGPTTNYGLGANDIFLDNCNFNDFLNSNNGTTFTFNGNTGTLLNGNNALSFQFNGNAESLLNGSNAVAFHFGGPSDPFGNNGNGSGLHNSSTAIPLHNSSSSDGFSSGGNGLVFASGHSLDGFFNNTNNGTMLNSGYSTEPYTNGNHAEPTTNGTNGESYANGDPHEQYINGIHTEIFLNENNGNGTKRESQAPSLHTGLEQPGFLGGSFNNCDDYGSSTIPIPKPLPAITNYPADGQGLYQDPSPQIVRRPALGAPQVYTQRVILKFLQPPPIANASPLIIKEVRAPQPPPPPPLFIRQRPPPPPMLPPLVIRECPPKLPPVMGPQVITKMLPPLPVPPRSVIIERLPPLPPRPRDVIVERWLPYRSLQKRRVIIQRAPPAVIPKPRNIIIYYEPAKAQIVRKFQNLGVALANPDEYVARYGAQLEDAHTLVSHARQAGVLEDISPPTSVRTSLQSTTVETGETSDGGISTSCNDVSEGNSMVGVGGYEMVNSNVGAVSSSSYDSISTNNTLGRTSGSAGDLESSFGSFGFADNCHGFGATNNYFDTYSSQHAYS